MDPSAFGLLAAPLAMPAVGGPDPSKLISFFAQEMQLFFAHIQSAVVHYTESGELPHSLFTQKQLRGLEKAAAAGDKRKEKHKRKPTAFNLFVKETLEEFKRQGVKDPGDTGTNNGLFKMAVAEWSKLSEEEKAEYQAKYAPVIAAMADGEGDGEEDGDEHHPLPQLGSEGGYVSALTTESPKKKKAKV